MPLKVTVKCKTCTSKVERREEDFLDHPLVSTDEIMAMHREEYGHSGFTIIIEEELDLQGPEDFDLEVGI